MSDRPASNEQELVPNDAYRLLSLSTSACGDLISEAYWLLVAHAKRGDPARSSQANEAELNGLNGAYQILAHADRRAAYDAEHGINPVEEWSVQPPRRRRVFEMRPSADAMLARQTHYEVLSVATTAPPPIIELAASIVVRRSGVGAVALHERIAEARRVLCDPELRAAYDASIADDRSTSVAPKAARKTRAAAHEREGDPGIITAVAMDVRDVARYVWRRGRVRRVKEDAGTEREKRRSEPIERQRVPPVLAWSAAAPVEQAGLAETPAKKQTSSPSWLRGFARRADGPARVVAPEHTEAKPAPKRQTRESAKERMIEAEQARLMTLRDDGDARQPVAADLETMTAVHTPLAQLAFTAGPRAGERIGLDAEPRNIGAADTADIRLSGGGHDVADEHARIWRHRDHFVFRQIDGQRTLIGGQPLMLPMVMLEDGDEITIGAHVFRFTERNGRS